MVLGAGTSLTSPVHWPHKFGIVCKFSDRTEIELWLLLLPTFWSDSKFDQEHETNDTFSQKEGKVPYNTCCKYLRPTVLINKMTVPLIQFPRTGIKMPQRPNGSASVLWQDEGRLPYNCYFMSFQKLNKISDHLDYETAASSRCWNINQILIQKMKNYFYPKDISIWKQIFFYQTKQVILMLYIAAISKLILLNGTLISPVYIALYLAFNKTNE
jgi:hypothetical protein